MNVHLPPTADRCLLSPTIAPRIADVLTTPLGDLAFDVHAQGSWLGTPVATFQHGPIAPILPPGMSVTASIAVLITLFPPIALSDVRISALWQRQFPADPRPTTGERLDALEWIDGNQIILLGTEDGDALAERLQAHGLDTNTYKHAYPLRYRPNGFDVLLPQVPAAASTTVHFIVAINAYPEPAEDSAWFAADVPHQRVLAELAS